MTRIPASLAFAVRARLPRGGELPYAEWTRRHHGMSATLWILTIGIAAYTLLAGYPIDHSLLHASGLAIAAAMASRSELSRTVRSLACSFGLLTAAAVGVHLSGGLIEAHFSFFVVVVLLTLYEEWLVFLLAVGYVLLHHGVLGMVDAREVFHDPDQFLHPWKWAAIHAVFVAAAGVAGVVAWRLNEDVRARMRETQEELRMAATTDVLTGLRNRRGLLQDLNERVGEPGATLTIFDLDGFKAYNDAFGHQAGDALLERLGRRLDAAVSGGGVAYRLGGDEFCALLGAERHSALHAGAVASLRERGEAFAIESSFGTVRLDDEAGTAEEALRLADGRMYEQKNGGRASAGKQSKDVLLRALAERHPDLGVHVDGVGQTAAAVAKMLGVSDDEVERIRQAAELHDVGKVAIPDQILSKPGPLDESEWEFMRSHTIIGERIVAAAPALSRVAPLVRSSHERWEGGGYPDGTAGDQIPLGARIVCVCDAFDAMVTDRPYRAAREFEAALIELDRCSGTQFDPAVVEAFKQVFSAPPDLPLDMQREAVAV